MQIVAKDCWLLPSNRNTPNTGSPSSCECLRWLCQPGPHLRKDRPAFPSIPDSRQKTHFEPGTLVLLLHWPWQITIGLLKLEGLIKGHCSTSPHPIHPLSPIESCYAFFWVVREAARGPGKWWPWYLPYQKANGPAAAPHPPGTLKLVGQKIGWQLSEQYRSTWDPQLGSWSSYLPGHVISKFNAPLLLLQVFALGSSEANWAGPSHGAISSPKTAIRISVTPSHQHLNPATWGSNGNLARMRPRYVKCCCSSSALQQHVAPKCCWLILLGRYWQSFFSLKWPNAGGRMTVCKASIINCWILFDPDCLTCSIHPWMIVARGSAMPHQLQFCDGMCHLPLTGAGVQLTSHAMVI